MPNVKAETAASMTKATKAAPTISDILERMEALEASLKEKDERIAELSSGMTMQMVDGMLVPVAPSQPIAPKEPVTYETQNGNSRTDR